MALGEGGGGGGGSARGVRAGAAYVELNGKDNLSKFMAGMKAKFLGVMKVMAAGALLAVGGGAAVLGMAFDPLVETLGDLRKIDDVAKAFGTTGRAASGLFGVLGAVGGEFKENLEGVIQFSSTVDKALHGIGQGAELFDGLSVSAKDLQGLAIDEQFYRVLGAIRELPQPLQESKLALLGGTDSMKQWQTLLTMSNDEVRQLADKLAFSNAELKQGAAAGRAYQRATLAVQRAWQQFAVAVAPLVQMIAEGVERAADGFTQWFKGRSLGNLWDESVAQFQVKMGEAFVWIKNRALAIWDYFAEGNGLGGLFTKFGDFFKSLVEYFAAAITKAGVAVAKTLGIDPDAITKKAFEAEIARERLPFGNAARADELQGYLDKLNDPAFVEQMRSQQIRQALAPDQAKFDAAVKAQAGLAEEWNAVLAGFTKKLEAREAQFKGADAALVAPALAQLKAAQERAQVERNTAVFAEFMDDLQTATTTTSSLGENMARVGRALGTFGSGAFLTQGFGVQSADKDVAKRLDTGNKLAAEGNKKLDEIVKKVGPGKFK